MRAIPVSLANWPTFCSTIVMSIKPVYFALPFLLLLSCADQEAHKTGRWKLDSFEGQAMCVLSFDPIPRNPIMETLLGLSDSGYVKTELYLSGDDDFKIVKDESITLTGKWHIVNRKTLLLTSKSDSWELEIITKNTDSLVLKADAFPDMRDVRITLKH